MSLDLIAASATFPGLATAGTQTMGGDKTFTGSTQFLRASATAYSATTFPPNPGTTYVNSTNSGTVSQVFVVRDVSTVAQYMSFTTYSPANAQVDFVMQSTLSGTTKEILRATGAGAWTFGPASSVNQNLIVNGTMAVNHNSTDGAPAIASYGTTATSTSRVYLGGSGTASSMQFIAVGGSTDTNAKYMEISSNSTLIARFYANSQLGMNDPGVATPAYSFFNDLDTGMYRNTTNSLGFSTGGTSAGTISSAGAWFFGNPSAAAQGITLQGNDAGYTASALKYYQEGSFTPTFTFSTPGSSSSTAQGYYVRIGRLVQFQAFIQAIVTTGASGGATLTLPFAGLNAGNCYVTCVFGLTNSITVLDKGLANPNTSVMTLLRSDGVTAIVAADFGGSAYFAVTVTYMIN